MKGGQIRVEGLDEFRRTYEDFAFRILDDVSQATGVPVDRLTESPPCAGFSRPMPQTIEMKKVAGVWTPKVRS